MLAAIKTMAFVEAWSLPWGMSQILSRSSLPQRERTVNIHIKNEDNIDGVVQMKPGNSASGTHPAWSNWFWWHFDAVVASQGQSSPVYAAKCRMVHMALICSILALKASRTQICPPLSLEKIFRAQFPPKSSALALASPRHKTQVWFNYNKNIFMSGADCGQHLQMCESIWIKAMLLTLLNNEVDHIIFPQVFVKVQDLISLGQTQAQNT